MAILVPNFDLAAKIGSPVEIDASTVGELIRIGIQRYGEPFRAASGYALISVNGQAISMLEGTRTPLAKDDQVWMILPAGGG